MTPDPIPAATLILMREGPDADALPEVLMVERGAALAFLGGAMVFPGGRVDPGDHALVPADAPDREETAARIAAIRETIEEVGLGIGLSPSPTRRRRPACAQPWRRGDPLPTHLPIMA
ncbi:hypothetical protein GCM10020258_28820 [Sphingomonas yabuuchiae]